jgi:hypothetical protein
MFGLSLEVPRVGDDRFGEKFAAAARISACQVLTDSYNPKRRMDSAAKFASAIDFDWPSKS